MNFVVTIPIVIPLLAAGVSLALFRRPLLQRAMSVVVLSASLAASIAVLVRVAEQGFIVVDLGGWGAPVGITLVADRFAAIMLVASTTMVLGVLVFSIGHPRTRDEGFVFHPVYLILSTGIALSLLTGDLFNLFVAFEIMLSASFVLLTLGGRREQIRPAMTYVVISLVASTLFVASVGLVYAATGTVNMADLAVRLEDIPEPVRDALGLLLLVVFGVKAAIFPLFFWLPDSYPTAPAPVTAIFAGLLTKVGVYAIIRTQTLLFQPDGPSTLLLVCAGATMIVGGLGALAQDDVKRILSFHIISQIGYMIMGLGFFTVAGIAAAIYYVVHNIVIKTTLFLVGGLIELRCGTGSLPRIHGLLHRAPVTAAFFGLSALSLAGLPPFSGFVGKLALVQAGTETGSWAIIAAALFAGLLTLMSMTKIWAGVFWGEPQIEEDPEEVPTVAGVVWAPPREATGLERLTPGRLMLATTGVFVAIGLALAIGAGPFYGLVEDAAADVADPARYVEAVLGR
ncbi:MAG: Na+/H+ antiporter subunit D [Acidimicrobiales bacterium]